MKKTLINPKDMVAPISKYSHGVKVEIGECALIFVTGQIALDKNGNLVGSGDAAAQAEYIFGELEKVLKEGGASMKDVVKATIFVLDMKDFPKVAEVRNKYFKDSLPASTFVEVKKLVRDGCLVEVEVIAAAKK